MSSGKITYIIDHLALSVAGTENQVFKMIPGLAREFSMELICLRENDWLPKQAQSLNCTVRFFEISNFRLPASYRNWWRLVRYLKQSAPDVVHTFFPVANIIGTLAARQADCPAVVASRRDFGEWMSRRYLTATKFANRSVDRIVTNSTQVKLLTQRVEGFPAERIEVILNGIDLENMKRMPAQMDLRRDLGIPDDDAVVTLVANFRPMKRQISLIEAASQVLAKRPDVSFLYVGKDWAPGEPLKSAVVARAMELGIRHKIFFAQATGDVARYLSFTDVGANCSYGEGISNAIMEYMACEVPCVVAASGGNPDLVTHDSTGLLFNVDRPDELAQGILALLDNRVRAAALARCARETLRTRMSIAAMIEHFRTFYLNLINCQVGDAVSTR